MRDVHATLFRTAPHACTVCGTIRSRRVALTSTSSTVVVVLCQTCIQTAVRKLKEPPPLPPRSKD